MVPLAPTGVTATAVSDGEVDLAWTDTSAAATGVEVLRADAGSADYEDVADLPAGTTTYADTDVLPGTQYAYQVAATGGASGTVASSPASPPSPVTTPRPGAVQNVKATRNVVDGVTDSITLTWSYSAADAQGFEVELMQATNRDPVENFSLWYMARGGRSGTYTFTGEPGEPFEGSQFEFRVRADRADGTVSDYAGAQATATSDAPSAHAAAIGGSFPVVQVSWTYPDHADSYDLEYRPAGDAVWSLYVHGVPGSQTSYSVPDLVAGLTYQFRVRAGHTGGNDSLWSDAGTDWSVPAAAAAAAEATAKTSDNGAEDDNQFPIEVLSPEVTADPIRGGQLRISWSETGSATTDAEGRVTPDQYGWACSISPDGTSWSEAGPPSFDPQSSFQDAGTQTSVVADVPAGWHYGVVVVAYNAASVVPDANGDGGYASPYSRRLGYGSATGVMPGDTEDEPVPPSAVVALVNPHDGNQILVHWHNNPNDEAQYDVYREFGSGGFDLIGTTAADVTTYTDPVPGTDLPGESRQYRIVAVGTDGVQSVPAWSDPVYQPYAPTDVGPGLDDSTPPIKRVHIGSTGYYWHRLLKVQDHDGV